jgi:hypothetical protein
MNTDAIRHDPQIARLVAQRRKTLPTDAFVTDHDGTDERGHKYREHVVAGPGGTEHTVQSDLTAMYQSAPSTTSDMELLMIEARLIDDGTDLQNPHIPATEELLARARDKIDAEGLTPAWEYGL